MPNPQAENGHIDIANEIAEALMVTQVSGYDNRVLWAIFRKTYGWHKKEDWIAFSQLEAMTKIHRAHISRAIKRLVERNIVTRNGNKLSFNKIYTQWRELPKLVLKAKLPKLVTKEVLPKLVQELPILVRELPKLDTTKETITKETITKENIERPTLKKFSSLKDIQDEDIKEIAENYCVPTDFVRLSFEKLQNYCESKGKVYKNYKSALRNFVLGDKQKSVESRQKNGRPNIVAINPS
jgi:phage replication O-like protein O